MKPRFWAGGGAGTGAAGRRLQGLRWLSGVHGRGGLWYRWRLVEGQIGSGAGQGPVGCWAGVTVGGGTGQHHRGLGAWGRALAIRGRRRAIRFACLHHLKKSGKTAVKYGRNDGWMTFFGLMGGFFQKPFLAKSLTRKIFTWSISWYCLYFNIYVWLINIIIINNKTIRGRRYDQNHDKNIHHDIVIFFLLQRFLLNSNLVIPI